METNVKRDIKCPNCSTTLSVDELLINQFAQSVREDLESELKTREEKLNQEKKRYARLQVELNQEKEDVDQLVQQRVRTQLESREESIRESIRKEVQSEKSKQLQELENELQEKSAQLIEHNHLKSKMARLSREFEEREATIHLKMENELSERLKNARTSMKEELQMESFLKLKEKENIIESLKTKLDDARQRASQGSIQLQGEVQEVILENWLKETHPIDEISEIKKGVKGADCLQTVKTKNGIIVGSIIYESKNTKNWSDSFVKKLRQDNLVSKADLMVIVTKTMPKEATSKYVLIDGVWVTTMTNVRDLSLLLRFGLLKTYAVTVTQTNKKDKMNLLYGYLTSEDFRATFESILDGFHQLQESHVQEQLRVNLIWKKRSKYLDQVLSSTIDFYGSVKAIGGEIVGDIPMLEFKEAS
ncbi:MAG: DUF2130 domain-containing protein [Fluviicola sp.]|nr:DUF2130 domain-containing protein [Fluviicola sp.]